MNLFDRIRTVARANLDAKQEQYALDRDRKRIAWGVTELQVWVGVLTLGFMMAVMGSWFFVPAVLVGMWGIATDIQKRRKHGAEYNPYFWYKVKA